ncbi:MAG: DUF4124 domain-containing protein [Gammaproteobacteria bacterium]|nr:DUF4124 domain-containing protein [Gammaproteobacteria bacterium]
MNYRIIPFFLMFIICALPVQAKMYKWVDEEGNTHFGDQIPSRYLNKEHKELNEQGAVVETHEEVVEETEEQRKERLKRARIEKEEKEHAIEQAKQDRVLLDTYTTERDLDAALKARLDAVDSQLQLSESIIADAKRKLDSTEKQITRLKAAGNEVPQNISDKMKNEEKQLKTYLEVAASHEKRKHDINEQFAAYIKRFRELKANQQRVKDEREARRKEALGL